MTETAAAHMELALEIPTEPEEAEDLPIAYPKLFALCPQFAVVGDFIVPPDRLEPEVALSLIDAASGQPVVSATIKPSPAPDGIGRHKHIAVCINAASQQLLNHGLSLRSQSLAVPAKRIIGVGV